jgi:hypothetical protein
VSSVRGALGRNGLNASYPTFFSQPNKLPNRARTLQSQKGRAFTLFGVGFCANLII